MGCVISRSEENNDDIVSRKKTMEEYVPPAEADVGEVRTYRLAKNRPGCTGMFWRADPRPGAKGSSTNDNWPRDGALLTGIVHEVSGKFWLECSAVKQVNMDWEETNPGAWMPFQYQQYFLVSEQTE
mmetsp:Transcript_17387/g.30646  ORF Transcript_17387/g.30646 Transcript_17387/m.30646 type:complete len:127 (-) Transcript_17387:1402-1782(-)